MPYKDPEKASACKKAHYEKTRDSPSHKAQRARNSKLYRTNHRAKVKAHKRKYEHERFATDPAYRAKQRARSAAKSRAARKNSAVKRARVIYQKARQYKLRSLGKHAAIANIRAALEQYRVGDKYLDVYSGDLCCSSY